MKLPAGDWKLSAGFENRRESADFTPDSFYTRHSAKRIVTAIEGSYITNEAYVETLVPIFSPAQDIPGLHRLEFEGAARRVDNSLAGNATTYTYGLRWSPIEDVHVPRQQDQVDSRAVDHGTVPADRPFESVCQRSLRQELHRSGLGAGNRGPRNCAAAGIPANFLKSSTQPWPARHRATPV